MGKTDSVFEVELDIEDPFYNSVQKGTINVKCSVELETAIETAAQQLGMKPSDFIRWIMKRNLIGLAKKGKIVLTNVTVDSAKKASGQ